MTRYRPRLLAAALLVGVLAGCGGPTAPQPAPPSTSSVPVQDPDQAACASHQKTAATVREIAKAVERGPVLPAAVALFLLDDRMHATTPGVRDPRLAAAQTELVAAIDDLDEQGSTLLPAGGNPAQDKVQLDATRILAAVDAVEQACATLG